MFSNRDLKNMIVPLFLEQLLVRLVFSYLLGLVLGLGVIGIAWAMCMNWIASAVAYMNRLRSGKWKQFKII